MQIRKHREQMSEVEITLAESRVQCLNPLFRSDHGKQRQDERNVSQDEIRAALQNGRVIEVSMTDTRDLRTLVRWDAPNASIVVVVSLKTWVVCTAWKNRPADTHRTLDRSIYQWNQDLSLILIG